MRDELSKQKLANQPFLFKGKIDLDGKIVETIMPFKDIEAFDNFFKSLDEEYDEGSIIVHDAHNFIKTDKKCLIKSNEMIMV